MPLAVPWTTARVFAKYLGDKLGQPVIVENRAGASGMIASDATAKATPDGYVLGFAASPTLTMSPLVQRSTLFDRARTSRWSAWWWTTPTCC